MKPINSNGIHIKVGVTYGEKYIKEIKGELESLHGVKLSRKTTDTQMTLICAQNKSCPYCFSFDIKQKPTEMYYKLNYCYFSHHSECWDPYKAQILKRKRFLEENSGALRKIMEYQLEQFGEIENPRSLLLTLASEIGETEASFYDGESTQSKNSVRAIIKKKFDNMVAELKKQILMKASNSSSQSKKKRIKSDDPTFQGDQEKAENAGKLAKKIKKDKRKPKRKMY